MRCWSIMALLIGASVASAGKYNPVLSPGDDAPKWKQLVNVDGTQNSLADLKQPIVVVVFTCNSCPYSVDYEDRINQLVDKVDSKEVAVVAINVNKVPEDSPGEMQKRSKEKGFKFPYLYDPTQQIARDYGATYTPEFFVLDQQRKVVYMGALDDSTDASKVKQHHVLAAIQAIQSGKTPKLQETVAIGCRIRFERQRRTRRK